MSNPIEKKLICLNVNKYYRISLDDDEKKLNKQLTNLENNNKLNKEINLNNELIIYVLDNKNSKINLREENFIKSLIK